MQTSAGIGVHFEEALHRSLHRAVAVESALRAVVAGAAVAACAVLGAFAALAVEADHHSHCEARRAAAGVDESAALWAMEHPDRQTRFLYRVGSDPAGYRVRVVARTGAFVGEAWERNALGEVRHVSDTCADEPWRVLGVSP